MLQAFHNVKIFTGHEMVSGKSLITENGRVKDITVESISKEIKSTDCGGGILAPGFVDLQIYGGGGDLFSAILTPKSLMNIGQALIKSGTTSFFITLATNSPEVFDRAMKIVKEDTFPALEGIHFEGPYLHPVRKGAHLIEFISSPWLKDLRQLVAQAEGVVKMMTIAPEIFPEQCLDYLLQQNILLSAGHSNANFQQATDAFNKGVKAVTHLFNAMTPIHHRDTGLPGAAFLHPEVRASIIADGIHVDFNALKISKQMMGERLYLITDAVEAASAGGYHHERKEDRFTLPDGTLSGSGLTLAKAVKNCIDFAGIPLEEALRMASLYPARLAGLDAGEIAKGSRANMVLLNEDFDVLFTVYEDKIIQP